MLGTDWYPVHVESEYMGHLSRYFVASVDLVSIEEIHRRCLTVFEAKGKMSPETRKARL
jgi:hypothetical protein